MRIGTAVFFNLNAFKYFFNRKSNKRKTNRAHQGTAAKPGKFKAGVSQEFELKHLLHYLFFSAIAAHFHWAVYRYALHIIYLGNKIRTSRERKLCCRKR